MSLSSMLTAMQMAMAAKFGWRLLSVVASG
jgi:hypothetical protein